MVDPIKKIPATTVDLEVALDPADQVGSLVPAVFKLVDSMLRHPNLTDEQKGKLARLRSYLEVHLADF